MTNLDLDDGETGDLIVPTLGDYTVLARGETTNRGSLLSGSTDWTLTEKAQIRHRLGLDGSASAPSAAASLVAAVWAHLIESGYSAERIMRLVGSVAAGKNGATANDFRNLSDTLDQMNGTVAGGKRTAVTHAP